MKANVDLQHTRLLNNVETMESKQCINLYPSSLVADKLHYYSVPWGLYRVQ